MSKIKTKNRIEIASFAKQMFEKYEPIEKRVEELIPNSNLREFCETFKTPYSNEIGGIHQNRWQGFLDYRGECLDRIAKEIIQGEFETYHCPFVDFTDPTSTCQRYRLSVDSTGEESIITCDSDFRDAITIPEKLELEMNLQCLRVIYDFVYNPCRKLFGEIKQVEVGGYEIDSNSLHSLVDPKFSLVQLFENFQN